MTNYEEYLKFGSDSDKEKQVQMLKEINISSKYTDIIKSISSEKNLLIFAEPFCPDCRILVAIVERIRALNPNGINIEYLSREENFGKLNMLSSDNRIPCVFRVDGIKIKKILEEYPSELEVTDEVKKEYREGKYTDLIIKVLLNALKSE